MNLTETFGNKSGYTINYSKLALMFLNEKERLQPIVNTPFAAIKEGSTYLGVYISPDVKQIVSLNDNPLVDRVREMLH